MEAPAAWHIAPQLSTHQSPSSLRADINKRFPVMGFGCVLVMVRCLIMLVEPLDFSRLMFAWTSGIGRERIVFT